MSSTYCCNNSKIIRLTTFPFRLLHATRAVAVWSLLTVRALKTPHNFVFAPSNRVQSLINEPRLNSAAFFFAREISQNQYFRIYSSTAYNKAQDNASMPRNIKKENLPTKICVVCKRPFTWRKKWERVWDEVTTCSKSCNHKRRVEKQQQNRSNIQSAKSIESIIDPYRSANHLETEGDEILTLLEMSNLNDDHNMSDTDENNMKNNEADIVATNDARAERKKARKLAKLKRRAERQGKGDPSTGQKKCDVCAKSVDLLIRCTVDETKKWKLVCGKCWNDVSGGVVDGDTSHPHYRYGGLWKNRRTQK